MSVFLSAIVPPTVSVGLAETTATAIVLEAPLEPGLMTMRRPVAIELRSLAFSVTLNALALMNVEGRAAPFHCTTDDVEKFAPLMDTMVLLLPTGIVDGSTDVMRGAGSRTRIPTPFDAPPPGGGLTTMIVAVDTALTSDAGIAAV